MMAVVGGRSGVEGDFLLHPELLSRDFLLLSLGQKNIVVNDAVNDKEKLTEIFVQHAMPLPQRQLPKSRWGKLMESKRGVKKLEEPHKKSVENIRKRPLIVFDGTSTSTSIKVKKKRKWRCSSAPSSFMHRKKQHTSNIRSSTHQSSVPP